MEHLMESPEYTFWSEIWDSVKRFFIKAVRLLSSRKFLAAVAATILIFQNGSNLETMLNQIAAVWIAFILGTAVEDGLSNR